MSNLYHHSITAFSHTKSTTEITSALHTQDPHESAFSCFSGITAFSHTKSTRLLCKLVHFRPKILMRVHFLVLVASQYSHTPSLLDYSRQLGALQTQDPHESAFSCFSGIIAFSHTKSTRLLCKLVHFRPKILMRVHFLVLVASQQSHTPSLLDYYANWCTSDPRSS